MRKPNIILIMADQLSAETLGIYGNPVVRTPALESLASSGTTFETAYCNYPACAPSRCSMFAGRYASTIRNHANHMLLDPKEYTLVHALREAGYRTALIGKNHAFLGKGESERRGGSGYPEFPPEGPSANRYDELSRLFDHVQQAHHGGKVEGFDDPIMEQAAAWALAHCWKSPGSYGTNPFPAEHQGSHLIGSAAVNYIEENRHSDRPFFLWLSFPDPHTPYQAPEPYASMYDPASIPLPPKDDLSTKPKRQRTAHLMDAMDMVDSDHLRRLRAMHYGMVNGVDDAIGRVIRTLEENGMRDDTIIVFTADHGDSMGAHGLIQKQNGFYDSFARIPLLISWPGVITARRTDELAELVDMMPTILSLAGIETPHGTQGSDLSIFLRGEKNTTKEFIVIESGEAGGDPIPPCDIPFRPASPWDESYFVWCAYREAWYGRGKAIRTKQWKLCVYENGEGELYNLVADPDELQNLYTEPNHREVVSDLERTLLRWCFKTEDRVPENTTVGLTLQRPRK